jgi:hypothetical protein
MRCNRRNAGCKHDISFDALELSRLDVRCEQIRPELRPAPRPRRGRSRDGERGSLGLWRQHASVRKRGFRLERQPPPPT